MSSRSDQNAELFSERTEMERSLGLTEALSILIGRIIGSGIFRTPASIMMLVGSVSMFFGAWLLGGIATLLGAFCYAEMVAMMPKSGGPYAFLKAAYPPVWTFLRGWAMFFVSETGAIAAVAVVFAEYGNSLYGLITGTTLSRFAEVLAALFIVWALTLINCFGVAFSGRIQNLLSLLKLLALGGVIGICFVKGGNPAHFSQPFWPDHFSWTSLLALGAAMRYVFFTFSGWEGATYVAEEVKNPRKNLPLSLILGLSGILLLYLAANGAYIFQLTPVALAQSKWVAVSAMEAAVGAIGGGLVSVAVMLNTFGSVNSQILVKARSIYAMSRDGLFFNKLGNLHPRFRTPNAALLIQGIWATVLLVGAAFAAKAYEAIIDFFAFTSSVFNIFTFIAVWLLRRKYPDALRPYRAPGYPTTLIIVLIIQIWFCVTTLITAFVPSMFGVLLTSSGLLFYYRNSLRGFFHKFRA
jgi:basic amino acid/polyamine antiporter, APA family